MRKKMVALSDGTERTVYRIKALRDFGDVKTGSSVGGLKKKATSHTMETALYMMKR